ncbi:MAG: sugar phosphate isomerase/epimerase [Chloroflexi bacterium]|nr:sugar phosphate isomerase/epimerase [Chloroflexota bacterium]
MTYLASLSTMWGVAQSLAMAEFAAAARKLGFSHLEMNYQLNPAQVAELRGLPHLPVSSLHDPCPTIISPGGKPTNHFPLASLKQEHREQAVHYAQDTIDLAAAVGARFVILHLGAVGLEHQVEYLLRRAFDQGLADRPGYRNLRNYLVFQRRAKSPPHLEAACRSLAELQPYAAERGVALGLENRYHYFEVPSLEEAEQLLRDFPQENMGYWHDFGHAETLARLGFAPHRDWLRRLGSRTLGLHLHDLVGLGDHRAPGQGDLDWDALAPLIPAQALRVLEVHHADAAGLAQGLAFLEQKGILLREEHN